ncbi:MAG: ATP-binding domain-containing protein, partial [Oscillospiraceae bacterium]|nr:ATP-binding domain-containing protein [Oscillospiraceae bacterium]
ESDREEGAHIAERMYVLHGKGRSYDEMAVLYRTNAQSRVIEDELRKLGIPYRIYGGLSFYQRKEIKDVLSYFRLVVNPLDDEALSRVINLPARGIGETTMAKVRDRALLQDCSMLEVVSQPAELGLAVSAATQKKLMQFAAMIADFQQYVDQMDAYTFAQSVVKQTGLKTALSMDKTQEGIDRAENVDELLSALREFVVMQQEAGAEGVNIRDFLSEVALMTDQDTKEKDDSPRVTLMTIHSAKGLEYEVVMIAGLEENLFPSMFCDSEHELEEERRLFYVAITRAKEECYVSSARTRFRNGGLQFQSPSRFIKDLDRRYVQMAEESIRRPAWESFRDDYPSAYPSAYPSYQRTPSSPSSPSSP